MKEVLKRIAREMIEQNVTLSAVIILLKAKDSKFEPELLKMIELLKTTSDARILHFNGLIDKSAVENGHQTFM